MARKRDISPGIWTSEQFMRLTHSARLLFIGMFSTADDEGRLRASPTKLKATIFPSDKMSLKRVETLRAEVVAEKLALLYTDGEGDPLLWLPSWNTYQKVNRRYPSQLPPHTDDTTYVKARRKRDVKPL